ncbi:MAG: hypothetical protein ACK4KW_05815 [Gemmobacter sp.]
MSLIAAVLTGDIVQSRRHRPETIDRALDSLRDAAEELGREHGFACRFTRFRGDGWQVFLPDPRLVLHACLFLTARLTAASPRVETRIAAGIGDANLSRDGDLAAASGSAFVVSGDHLDRMPRRRRMIIAGAGIGPWQAAVFELVEWTAQQWSPAQAEAVALALLRAGTNESLARGLGITRQAFEARLSGSGFAALDGALAAFRHHDFTDTDR